MNVQSYAQITTKFSKLPDTYQLLTLNSFFQALPKFPNEIERVRTLAFVTTLEEHGCRTDFKKCLSEFNHLRSLELMDVCELLPDRIGSLKQSRYLNLVENTKLKSDVEYKERYEITIKERSFREID